MSSSITNPNQSQKHSDIENGSNPQTDAASRPLEGHPQPLPPHGSSFRPSGKILFDYFMALVIAVFALLILIWYFINMISYTFIKPKELTVHLVSFSANNFNITDGILEATWEASVNVVNPNKNFMADLLEMEMCVYYREHVHSLARESREPFTMGKKSNTTIVMKRSMSKGPDHQPQRWVVDDMEKERNGGSVSLGLEIRLVSVFTTGSLWTWRAHQRDTDVSCGDIKVVFEAGSTTGTLATGDKPRECSLHAP